MKLFKDDDFTPMADLYGQMMATHILKILDDHYHGYNWVVHLDEKGRMVQIINKTLADSLMCNQFYGYEVYAHRLENYDNRVRIIKDVGGEILERANMPRGPWDGVTYPTEIEGVREKHQPIFNADGQPVILVPQIEKIEHG